MRTTVIVLAALTLWGCASTTDTPADLGPVFYPSTPAPARLQYLTRFSSQLDLGEKDEAFRDFVFGKETTENHLVRKPYGVAMHDGAVFVVDTRSAGYAVFDLKDDSARLVQSSGAGRLQKPINISIDTDGTRYITDTKREQIVVFDASDRYVNAFGSPGEFRPVDVAIVDDQLYVTDILNHRIVVLDKLTGQMENQFGTVGSDPGELFQPTNLALGPDRRLYVTDTGNFQVDVFSLDGEFVREIGQIGTVVGQFARPKGIALDDEQHIYIVDAAFQNVQILAPDGTPLLFFGGPGSGPGGMNLPTAIKVDYDNVAYFQKYADPSFELEYVVLVASQFGANKVAVFGFGAMRNESEDTERQSSNGEN